MAEIFMGQLGCGVSKIYVWLAMGIGKKYQIFPEILLIWYFRWETCPGHFWWFSDYSPAAPSLTTV